MSEVAEKKTRSPIERLIVWGLIALLLVVVLVEYRASSNYNAAREYLENTRRPTLDDVKANISGATATVLPPDELGTNEVEFAFMSIFRRETYKLRVQLADIPEDLDEASRAERTKGGGRVVDYYQPAMLAEVQRKSIEDADKPSDPVVYDGDSEHDGEESFEDGAGERGEGRRGGGPRGERPGGEGRRDGAAGRGGRTNRGIVAISGNPEVREKLSITDEQADGISAVSEANPFDWASMREMEPAERAAMREEYTAKIENGLREVLNEEQFETVQRMSWAQQGPIAIALGVVATKIGLTEDQVSQVAKIRDGMDFRNPPNDEILEVLNDEQKAKWESLIEGMEPPSADSGQTDRPDRPSIEE